MTRTDLPQPNSHAAVIVAAGRGMRLGGKIPKQYQLLDGKPVLHHTVNAFVRHPRVTQVIVVIHPDDTDLAAACLPNGVTPVFGGATRGQSVANGLAAVDQASHVLIHDGARPLVSAGVIDRVCDALRAHPGAAPALPVTDALWRGQAHVTGSQSRENLWRAQTPQGFALNAIRAAYAADTGQAADDVEVARAFGLDVAIVAGEERNLKLTHAPDFDRASHWMKGATPMDVRLGNGFDVHRFGPGDHVMLCGVRVPHSHALQGHSDADVGLHAIADALYGALAAGDIGRHFPPSDPQWKGAASHIFLAHAAGLVAEKGFRISNIDCTLVCEHPKITPHAPAMQAMVARICGISPDRVSVKATTSEKLGFTGREEGIACLTTAALVQA